MDMKSLREITARYTPFFFSGLLLFGLYLASLYSYLFAHSLAELFSVVIGCNIFIVAWNSRQRLDNHFFLFLGIAYLFVSLIDLLHILAYKGISVFVGYNANLPTQLWIAARYCQSLSLLVSPLFLRRKLNIYLVVGIYMTVIAVVLAVIFGDVFPTCYVEGVGLTPFKKISEYIISGMLFFSIGLFLYKRQAFDSHVVWWLVASLVLTIASEMSLTLYTGVYDLINLIGHFFKLIAFYLIYIAIVEMGLEKPQRLLFQDLKRRERALQRALRDVRRLAITDPLTGLYNQRHFTSAAEAEVQRACRYQRPLSAVMMDIDHFKRVNDSYGHTIGDRLLQKVAESCRKELRKADVVGRYGGDEFAIMLPEIDLAAARRVAERLRKTIAQTQLKTPKGPARVTASLGVAAVDCDTILLEALLSRADKALYVAKRKGRNQVRTA
jgi:diguanylate cyclase (GGDEF)-like protein